MKHIFNLFLLAVEFLTRLPLRRKNPTAPEDLGNASIFFPVVGLLVALGAVGINSALRTRLNRDVVVVLILIYLVLVTGGFHEDALADAADGLGGGWNKDQILTIMHDSRIGSFGALAVTLSLLARFVFLISLPRERFSGFLITAQVLSRWTALPLGHFLRPARGQAGQGARVAGEIGIVSLVVGIVLALGIVWAVLGVSQMIWPVLVTVGVTAASAAYYRSQIGGVTGDCMGATNQIAEAAVYLTGVVLH
ncbi:MAG TPA: adenosylcobinamide-GDP ribazoletransferase [Terriglobia bacterium]|nr:adenosylcobinamide-GDP ribazoletransferase [Terriglobia bacterium]